MIINQLGEKYEHDAVFNDKECSYENLISIKNDKIAIGTNIISDSIHDGVVNNNGISITNTSKEGRSVICSETSIYSGEADRGSYFGIIYEYNDTASTSYYKREDPRGTGFSLSIYDENLLIGSFYGDLDNVGLQYIKNSEIYTFISNKPENTGYGKSVSLYENIALVSDNSHVYYFTISDTTASENSTKRITREAMETILIEQNFITAIQNNKSFGMSISHIGDVVAIGDPSVTSEGVVYVYNYSDESAFVIRPKYEIDVYPKYFGSAVFMYENIILICAPQTSVNNVNNVGRVYICTTQGKFLTSLSGDETEDEYYGLAAAMDNDTLVVRSGTGAYAYRIESEFVGDPYIKPMYGSLYKLPDVDAVYRILEGENVIINAHVQVVQQEYINHHTKMINDKFFNDMHKDVYNWDSMYFFTQLCIHYNDEIAMYNMLNTELLSECPSWLSMKVIDKKTENCAMYENENVVKAVELNIDNILNIEAALYINPQILTGLKLKSHKSKLNGLLMYKYSSESAKVKSLYDTEKCNFKDAGDCKVITEIFDTNNGTSKTRKISVV